MKRPTRRSPKIKPFPQSETPPSPFKTSGLFLGNKILDELKILIRLAAPEAGPVAPEKKKTRRRSKFRPLRDAA